MFKLVHACVRGSLDSEVDYKLGLVAPACWMIRDDRLHVSRPYLPPPSRHVLVPAPPDKG